VKHSDPPWLLAVVSTCRAPRILAFSTTQYPGGHAKASVGVSTSSCHVSTAANTSRRVAQIRSQTAACVSLVSDRTFQTAQRSSIVPADDSGGDMRWTLTRQRSRTVVRLTTDGRLPTMTVGNGTEETADRWTLLMFTIRARCWRDLLPARQPRDWRPQPSSRIRLRTLVSSGQARHNGRHRYSITWYQPRGGDALQLGR